MSEMKTVRTAELIGEALDWAVAKALGWQMVRVPSDIDGANDSEVIAPPDFSKDFKFPPRGAIPAQYFLRRWSTDWSQGGPLLEQFGVAIGPKGIGQDYVLAVVWHNRQRFIQSGQTTLIASARVIVESRLGHEVQIPAELLP